MVMKSVRKVEVSTSECVVEGAETVRRERDGEAEVTSKVIILHLLSSA